MLEQKKIAKSLCKKYNVLFYWKKNVRYGAWGVAHLGINKIGLSEKLLTVHPDCTAHCVLHEIAHIQTGQKHTKDFYTKFSLLLMENRIFGIKFGRCGYYKEYTSEIAACK